MVGPTRVDDWAGSAQPHLGGAGFGVLRHDLVGRKTDQTDDQRGSRRTVVGSQCEPRREGRLRRGQRSVTRVGTVERTYQKVVRDPSMAGEVPPNVSIRVNRR